MAKKPTIMETKKRIDDLTRHVNWLTRMSESLGIAFTNYIKFKGNEEDFKNYLENSENLHKLTEEEINARNEGHYNEDNETSTKEIRKESDGAK